MFLGIDLGTTDIKALLMDDAGRVVAGESAGLSISRPRPHWSEQNPQHWWDATIDIIDLLQRNHPRELAAVRGIGLSGQMHGAVLLDRADKPLRPAILWNDTRCANECAELTAREPSLHAVTGNLAMPGFTAPKLLWVDKHEPDHFRRLASVLLPKDYLRLCLTGEKVSDMSDASGTLWLDVGARRWSDPMLAATGLTKAQMPALVEGSQVSARLRPELAQRWGMQSSVGIAGGAGDNAAGAIGIGAVSPGDGFISLGTSGVVFMVNDRFRPNPQAALHAFCHALPQRWHQMSVMLSAASCLRWVTGITGATDESSLLDEVASAHNAVADSPIFLPYLSGERTPHNDADSQGVFFGLTHQTNRADLGYAVLEGVAFGLADGLAALAAAGSRPAALSLIGGGARSPYWAQLIANVLDTPVLTHPGGEAGAALGAARLAQIANGFTMKDVCSKPATLHAYEPQRDRAQVIEERLHRFRALYPAVRPLFESK